MWKIILFLLITYTFQGCRETESSVPAGRVVKQDRLQNLLSGGSGSESSPGSPDIFQPVSANEHPRAAGLALKTRPRIKYNGMLFTLSWPAVAGAKGYNLYFTDNPRQARDKWEKINPEPLADTTYTYPAQNLKGTRIFLAVCGVDSVDGREVEGRLSAPVGNDYFQEFKNMTNPIILMTACKFKQELAFLPGLKDNPRKRFLKFMEGPGRSLQEAIRAGLAAGPLNPSAQLSFLAVLLLEQAGITAYHTEGKMLSEPHNFVVVKLDGVEYILDFSADRFYPGAAPVFMPRDRAFLTDTGTLGTGPAQGQPLYTVGRVHNSQQIIPDFRQRNNQAFIQQLEVLTPLAQAVE